MQPIVNGWSSIVCWSVGQSVTIVSPAKTTELMKMLFGLWVDPRNHVLDCGGPDLHVTGQF